MNAPFITIAAILLAWITLWLGRVLWRGVRHDSEIEHHVVNTAVLRDQLLELEQDHANGQPGGNILTRCNERQSLADECLGFVVFRLPGRTPRNQGADYRAWGAGSGSELQGHTQ